MKFLNIEPRRWPSLRGVACVWPRGGTGKREEGMCAWAGRWCRVAMRCEMYVVGVQGRSHAGDHEALLTTGRPAHL